jgi:hypothetical protein
MLAQSDRAAMPSSRLDAELDLPLLGGGAVFATNH